MSEIEDALTAPKLAPKSNFTRDNCLSSGSTLLNLNLTDTIYGAFVKGTFNWFVGDSDTGKTFLAYTSFAEAALNPAFDDYELIEDQVEGGALMDRSQHFGDKAASRIVAPAYDKDGFPVFSETVDDYYFNLDKRLDLVLAGKAKKFIYILDSMDALDSKYAQQRFDMRSKAHEEGKQAKGDFTDGKAKANSQNIRRIKSKLQRTGCILIIISQTRDNPDAGMFESKSTVAGGRSLKFHAICQIWSSPGGTIKKTFRGIDRQLGIISRLKIKKNHLTGQNGELKIPIYHSHGIDDVESCIDYLIDERHWTKAGSKIDASEFDVKLPVEKLIAHVQKEALEPVLRKLVGKVWRDTKNKIKPVRIKRYQ